jgi:hypothetical protein
MKASDLRVPEDREEFPHGLRQQPAGGHVGVRRHQKKDGTAMLMDIIACPVRVEGRDAFLAIGTDVTATRQIEEQLRDAQKMDAIAQLAGGIAHDFNNMLAVIIADADFARAALEDEHPAAQDVDEIGGVARRAAALVRQLLTFSKRHPRQPRALELNEVVADVEKMASRLIGDDVQMSVVLASRLGTIEADEGEIEQVIVSLVLNARDAIPDEGKITIETSNVELDGERAAVAGIAPGRYVMLAVADTGRGMDDATRKRIFEPFFTTKPMGRGSGLGLATVFGIAQQSQAGIDVTSRPGGGTTFRLFFPRVEEPRSRPSRPSRPGSRSLTPRHVVRP